MCVLNFYCFVFFKNTKQEYTRKIYLLLSYYIKYFKNFIKKVILYADHIYKKIYVSYQVRIILFVRVHIYLIIIIYIKAKRDRGIMRR